MGLRYCVCFFSLILLSVLSSCGDDSEQSNAPATKEQSLSIKSEWTWDGIQGAECEASYRAKINECDSLENKIRVIQNQTQMECREKANSWLEKKTRDLRRSQALVESQFVYCLKNLKAKFEDPVELSNTCTEVVQPLLKDLKTICED